MELYRKEINVFIAISYLLLSLFFIIFCNSTLPNPSDPLDSWKFAVLMYTPTLAAILTSKIFKTKPFNKNEIFGSINKWTFYSLIIPIFISIISVFVSIALIPDVYFNPDLTGFSSESAGSGSYIFKQNRVGYIIMSLLQSISSAWGMSTVMAFGEELGWRGFLFERLKSKSVLSKILIIGPIWGLWHSPLILKGYNYPTNPVAGVAMMALTCTVLSALSNYIREKSGSVWGSAIFHGSFNSFGYISLMPLRGDSSTFYVGFMGFSGIISMLLI
jgi:uncharacterized protein